MSGFSADWLDLRAPYDSVARDGWLEQHLAAWARERNSLRVLDLGSGTGSNLRHLAARLPVQQTWTLIEYDAALIAAGRQCLGDIKIPWSYRQLDLAANLDGLVEDPIDLITCSALLDLVSKTWLDRLARLVEFNKCALLAVLTYDGRMELMPRHPLDGEVLDLVNRHQRSDKGFGPAMGPDAAAHMALELDALPGKFMLARSDWQVGPGEKAMQLALLEGWARAAAEVAPERAKAIDEWLALRRSLVMAGLSSFGVGHQDLLYLPS